MTIYRERISSLKMKLFSKRFICLCFCGIINGADSNSFSFCIKKKFHLGDLFTKSIGRKFYNKTIKSVMLFVRLLDYVNSFSKKFQKVNFSHQNALQGVLLNFKTIYFQYFASYYSPPQCRIGQIFEYACEQMR